MVPGFERHLVGAEKGAHLSFEIELAPDYADPKLAGKTVQFEVDVVKVEVSSLPDVDAEFISSFGIDDGQLETFRAEVKSNLERQTDQAARQRLKATVMNALYEKLSLALPASIVDQEVEQLSVSAQAQVRSAGRDEQKSIGEDTIRAMATRRIALALIISEVVDVARLKADSARVRSMIEALAQGHTEPEALINFYNADPERKKAIEQMVLEDQVVDWVLDRAQVVERAFEYDELVNFSGKPQPEDR